MVTYPGKLYRLSSGGENLARNNQSLTWGAVKSNEGKRWMVNDNNVMIYYTRGTSNLPIPDHITKKEHQAVRRYLDIL